MSSQKDLEFMNAALHEAILAQSQGNLPIGCVIVLDGAIIARGGSRILTPQYNPWNHAECEAMRHIPAELLPRTPDMTVYTTLEPCVMCYGTMLLHRIGRIVFGASDTLGGARTIIDHLPPYYNACPRPEWIGPIMPEKCDALYQQADKDFRTLPCGR